MLYAIDNLVEAEVKSRSCKSEGCNKQPIYNVKGQKKGLYCLQHKTEEMVNVISKMCIHEGCNTIPNYNVEGETKALYCSEHKTEGMVDVKNKSCIHEGCNTIPIYNVEGETKRLYCKQHRREGMVNVISKTCCEEGCKKQPTYNVEGQKKGLYCLQHKTEGMVDVKNKSCKSEGCNTQPHYNVEGQKKGLYCSEHKKEGMVDVISKSCIHEGCNTIPNYNVEGQKKGLYCLQHKTEEMVDVKNKSCKSEWCTTQVLTIKYYGYCLFCFINLFPDKPVSRNYKTKEYAVVEFVLSVFPDVDWIADKIINGGCSKRRPDLILDLGYQILIVEVDENQHNNYDCSCENKRLMQLSQDMGHRPIIFIRFNPDKYEKNGITITSCWGKNENGICVVKKSKKDEWNQRLNVLKEHINYWIDPQNITNKTVEVIQLFYDE